MSEANSPDSSKMEPPVISTKGDTVFPHKGLKWVWLAVFLTALALMILFSFDPSHFGFYPRCWMYACTGLYCPGCGGLRATHHLLHGELLLALRCNPLFILALPWLAWQATWRSLHFFRKGTWPEVDFNGRTVFWLIAVMVVFSVLRNIHGAPFIYLAPPAGL